MAESQKIQRSKRKGVAFAKWSKIDKAQRNMLIAVCFASMALGITAVAAIYMIRVIGFNANVISEKDKVINDYKTIQQNLATLSDNIDTLKTNESLEVIARTRSDKCSEYGVKDLTSSKSVENLEIAHTCTALRVIPDTLPSVENKEAMLASFNQLAVWSSPNINIESLSGTEMEWANNASEEYDEYGMLIENSGDDGGYETLKVAGASIMVDDSTYKVYSLLNMIERSVRNFDIASATIEYPDDSGNSNTIKLGASYRVYYSTTKELRQSSKNVCADKNSRKCSGGSN